MDEHRMPTEKTRIDSDGDVTELPPGTEHPGKK